MSVDEQLPTTDVCDTIMAQLRTSGQNEKAVHVSVGTILVVMRQCTRHSRWSPTAFLVTSKPPVEEAAKVASWRAGLLTNTCLALADGTARANNKHQQNSFGFEGNTHGHAGHYLGW
jgi:hypothetical protein